MAFAGTLTPRGAPRSHKEVVSRVHELNRALKGFVGIEVRTGGDLLVKALVLDLGSIPEGQDSAQTRIVDAVSAHSRADVERDLR